jgi:hypothetical protein
MADSNSRVYLGGVRVGEDTLSQIRKIAIRRKEIVSDTVEKALSSYVKTDERTQRRRRG